MRLTALALVTAMGMTGSEISAQLIGGPETSSPAVSQARAMAVRIFSAAGLDLEWCVRAERCRDWEGRIIITLLGKAPARLSAVALAEAQAFDGRNIRIYLSRIMASTTGSHRPALLAHVMVHEITHLLQASDHHAEEGVMKARWSRADFAAMERARLAFTHRDIELIQAGMARRRTILLAAAR